MKRLHTTMSAGLALLCSGIKTDPEIALIPVTGEGSSRPPGPFLRVPVAGPLPEPRGPRAEPRSTNLYTRAGRAVAAELRAICPGIDLDTIKGLLRNDPRAWDKVESMAKKAHGS